LRRNYGVIVFVGFLVVGTLALVALLMYMLTAMNWRFGY
jgi:hypothetical protein